VEFITEYAPGIPGRERLRYDFFVANTLLIEFDGKQHFEPVEFFGGKEAFMRMAERDLIKTQWAISTGRNLLRIPYYQRNSVAEMVKNEVAKWI
jgi:hypothetical protein